MIDRQLPLQDPTRVQRLAARLQIANGALIGFVLVGLLMVAGAALARVVA